MTRSTSRVARDDRLSRTRPLRCGGSLRFIDRFSVLLFDMHGTFAFGEDRFGPEQGFYATYRSQARVLFVGDSLERDIRPARALALSTAWVAPAGSSAPEADLVVR